MKEYVSLERRFTHKCVNYSALVAAGIDGVNNRLVLPAPVNQDPASISSSDQLQDLPRNLEDSLEQLSKNITLKEALGQQLTEVYLAVKRAEAKSYKDCTLAAEVEKLERRF